MFLIVALMAARDVWAQALEQTLEGVLTVVWGDPRPGETGGETRYMLTLADGRTLPLQLAGQEATAMRHFNRHVIVSGRIAPVGALVVDTITSGLPGDYSPAPTTGTRRVIYLLAKFSDDSAVPHPPYFYTNLNNPDTPPAGEAFPATVNGFFRKTSYNLFSWVGDVGGAGGLGAPGGWLMLPNPKAYYAPCGWESVCAKWQLLADDATALGRTQGINFGNYDNINIVLSNDLDCCAWGGGYYSTVDNKSYGMTWMPPWGQEASLYVHEMGHSLGLPHSGWVYYAYDSPWDEMSGGFRATSSACGSYASRNSSTTDTLFCAEPGGGYIVAHKDVLGWIPSANKVTVSTSSAAAVTLEAAALPLTSPIKMIKICLRGWPCTGSAARYFTVEARVKGLGTTSQFDNGIPGEGIIIHDVWMDRPGISGPCFFNSSSGWALLIDSTPGDWEPAPTCGPGARVFPNYALLNAQWMAGQIYTSSEYAVSIEVAGKTGEVYAVSVRNSVFTDDPLIPGVTPVKAVHITELRARIEALRSRYQVGGYSWTDPTLTAAATLIRAQHVGDLRNALAAAYSAAGRTPPTYTDPALTAGMTVRALHIAELRSAVANLE